MMDDTALLRAYAETRSETAFAGFVARRIGFVHATALRMVSGNAHTAQDVTQTVFVLAANKAATLAQHERLAGWLHTTTCNLSLRALRESRRRATHEQEAARMNEIENENNNRGSNTVLENHGPNTLRPLLDNALRALREDEREAVLLRYFERMEFANIGVKFQMSEEAARKRVTRAVEKMRAAFAKRGVTSSAAALSALMTTEAAQAAPAGLAASVSASAITSAAATAAAASASASMVSAILAFMSSAKLTTVAVVALLIAAGGAYYGSQSERALSSSLAQARQENASLETQLRGAEKQNAKASAATAERDRAASEQAFLADHPDLKEKMAAWAKAQAIGSTFRISHEMNLSPEQSERLAEIVNTRGFRIGDLRFGNMRPSSKVEQDLRDLLGDEGYAKFNELSALDDAGADFNIQGVSNALSSTDTPLTSEQARSLDKIASDLAKNHADITDPQARWNAFMEQAKSVVSPAQMSALMSAGDRYIWEHASAKWKSDYYEANTVITAGNPFKE